MASLSSIDRPAPFSFEHAWEMTEADFVRLNTPPVRPSTRGWIRLAAFALFGVAALFWRYTAAVGVLALLLVAFGASMPRIVRWGARSNFAKSAFLHGPVAYGVSSRGFWLRGRDLGAESGWAGLRTWQERHGWLILYASGMPPVYLPLEELRTAGLYDAVAALARAHTPELGAADGGQRA